MPIPRCNWHSSGTAAAVDSSVRFRCGPDKSMGNVHDGWKLTLGICSSFLREKAVTFENQDFAAGKQAAVGFDVMAKIINRHLKNARFP